MDPKAVETALPHKRKTNGSEKAQNAYPERLAAEMNLTVLNRISIRDLIDFAGPEADDVLVTVLAALFFELEKGGLCLEIEQAHFRRNLPNSRGKEADLASAAFLERVLAGRYATLVDIGGTDFKPLVVIDSNDTPLVYFHRYYHCERELKTSAEKLIAAAGLLTVDAALAESIIHRIYTPERVVRTGRKRRPIVRDREQTAGLELAMKTGFGIVSGGPGTGKTSLMVNILRCFVRMGIPAEEILLAAPTGRAAQRMTDAVRETILSLKDPSPADRELLSLSGSTIHKMLQYSRFRGGFSYGKENPLPARAIVIDEVSMIDVALLESLLCAVAPGKTRLLLMGDQDQLPSVEAGTVFAGMIPGDRDGHIMARRLVVLKEVYRSGRSLVQLAQQVNQGLFPQAPVADMGQAMESGDDTWAYIPCDTPETLRANLLLWADRFFAERASGGYRRMVAEAAEFSQADLTGTPEGRNLLTDLFSAAGRARVLTFLRRGPFGAEGINRVMTACFLNTVPAEVPPGAVFSGAQIIITRNDYRLELYNGDTGIVLKDADERNLAYFYRFGEIVGFPLERLPVWEPAFAMTVHKSQGSEFDHILLVLPETADSRILSREILYTGITRARRQVIICGNRQALDAALARKIERHSGLLWS